MRHLRVSLVLLPLLTFGLAASAGDIPYRIMFRDKGHVDAIAAPTIKDGRAYFTTVSGQEFVIRAERIDAAASDAENQRRQEEFQRSSKSIISDEEPINSSLGSRAAQHAQEQSSGATRVTDSDLNRVNSTELPSITPIATPGPATTNNIATPAEQPAPGPGGTTTTTDANGQTTTTINIQVPLPAAAPAASAPAPAPASEGGNQ